ncbi:hypothetical protein LCGC14_2024760, partial [marine sediment metagenome]
MPPKKKNKKGVISGDEIPVIVEVSDEEVHKYLNIKLQLPKEHLSPSSIGMYLRCPMQFFKRYIEGKKRPPGVSLMEGTCHHSTCEYNNIRKKKSGKDRSEKQVIEHFCDTFHDKQKEIEDWEGIKERDVLLRGRKLQTAYINNFAPRLKPRLIEQGFVIQVGPVKILCYTDVAGTLTPILRKTPEMNVVCDYKTASKSKSETELEHSYQLTTYGICDMAERTTDVMSCVGMCVFKKIKIPIVEWQSAMMTVSRINWFKITTLSVANAISRGSFPVCDP